MFDLQQFDLPLASSLHPFSLSASTVSSASNLIPSSSGRGVMLFISWKEQSKCNEQNRNLWESCKHLHGSNPCNCLQLL